MISVLQKLEQLINIILGEYLSRGTVNLFTKLKIRANEHEKRQFWH